MVLIATCSSCVVGQQPRDLGERLGGHDHRQLGPALGQLDRAHGQAEAVGGRQRQPAPPIFSSAPARTGRVSSGAAAKTTPLMVSLSGRRRNREARATADLGNRRKVLGVDARDVGLVATARQVHLVRLRVELELDLLAVVEQRDVVGQQPRGQA